MRRSPIAARIAAKLPAACALAILLAAPSHGRAEGIWSGTITESVEFGITRTRERTQTVTKGSATALITSRADQEVFRDLIAERKLEIAVQSNHAVAAILGKASWFTKDGALHDVSPCYETATSTENLDVMVTSPRSDARFSVAIDARGRYSISSSGSEKISFNGFRETRHITMCDHKKQVWTGGCYTAPPRWNLPCRSSYTGLAPDAETQQQYWQRTGGQSWTRNWEFKASGSTCSPNHLVGSRTEETNVRAASGLPPWFSQTMTRAAIRDKYGSRPEDLPFVLRITVSWDLKREDPVRNLATGCSYHASGGQGIAIEGTICNGLGESFKLTGRPPDGSRIEFSYSPSGESSGSLTYTGRGGPFTMAGKGNYSIKPGAADTLILTQTDSGCMTNVPFGGCSAHTNNVTLTPIPSCR